MFNPEGFSLNIFRDRYALTEEETWQEACGRVAHQMATAERPDVMEKYRIKFYEELVNNRFVPGGRIWYNSGRPNPQLLNCFVLRSTLDSKEGWGDLSREMIITSMTGGGCGIDFSDVRPRGASIRGQRGTAPGPVELMKLINGSGDPIRAGGSRRTALMFSLDMDHPSIEEFLDAKLEQGELQLANISIRCKNTDKFINAVLEDKEWELQWKGQYKSSINARQLWQKIVTNAYNCAEPGFLNWELALNESTIYYIEDLVTTNPCGEIALPEHDCCDLGHLVLPRFVSGSRVNWEDLGETVRIAVRFLDNVLSVNHFPLPEMKEKSEKLRRIGLGTTGLADMLALLGYKYGSEEANKFVDKLYRFISKSAYESSVMLAIEKGPFPACRPDLHVKSGYVKRMTPKIKSLIKEHGIRNCALLTQAPTGTVSIMSGNCSSGIEPMFAYAYERRFWQGDKRKTELVFHPLFVDFMTNNKDVEHFVASQELNIEEHMQIQSIVQKHIDNAVSKTINMAEDYPMDDMAETWLRYLPLLKGTTFYRENSRKFVGKDDSDGEPPLKPLSLEEAKERFYAENPETILLHEEKEQKCKGGMCEL